MHTVDLVYMDIEYPLHRAMLIKLVETAAIRAFFFKLRGSGIFLNTIN